MWALWCLLALALVCLALLGWAVCRIGTLPDAAEAPRPNHRPPDQPAPCQTLTEADHVV